jgi:hypothetical protein
MPAKCANRPFVNGQLVRRARLHNLRQFPACEKREEARRHSLIKAAVGQNHNLPVKFSGAVRPFARLALAVVSVEQEGLWRQSQPASYDRQACCLGCFVRSSRPQEAWPQSLDWRAMKPPLPSRLTGGTAGIAGGGCSRSSPMTNPILSDHRNMRWTQLALDSPRGLLISCLEESCVSKTTAFVFHIRNRELDSTCNQTRIIIAQPGLADRAF